MTKYDVMNWNTTSVSLYNWNQNPLHLRCFDGKEDGGIDMMIGVGMGNILEVGFKVI